MKKLFAMANFVWLIVWIIPNPPGSWASTTEAIVTESDQIAGAPTPPTPSQENRQGLNQNGSGWGNEYLQQAPHLYDFSKNHIQFSHGSAIPLKSPGTFPGIELGVEMHSFQALPSVVSPEILSNSFKFQEDQPLLLSPSTISPDFNGGVLRFTW